jgi:kinesin family protein 5
VKERLEAAKAGSTRGLGSPTSAFSFGGAGSRIAKPLRGGGGIEGGQIPIISSLQNEAGSGSSSGATNKRSSWFFSGGQK